MTQLQAIRSKPAAGKAAVGRLFVLDASGNRIQSMNTDGSDRKMVVSDCRAPDGIVVDAQAGHIYWTNMGVVSVNDGSIERADLDGKNRKGIIPIGATFTPKQLHLDKTNGKLYWCDREGMRVLRSNLDGSHLETLVETGRGDVDRRDLTRWCVGITIDPKRQQIYWTQKGPDNAGLVAFFAQISTYRAASVLPSAPISKCCSIACRSRSILSSIWKTEFSIGPIAATLRVATR